MAKTLTAACIQLNSGPDIAENIKNAEALIREAAGQGATLIATPENTDSIRRYASDRKASPGDPAVETFARLAEELNVWVLIGSLAINQGEKLANRSFLFAPNGKTHATYDKIHMFDATLSRKEFYKESNDYEPGHTGVLAKCDDFNLGLGICYDLRFPHYWRDLGKNGADILAAPAAFTVPTGKAHWEVLLRARAIEAGSFVIAPGQTGSHEGGRETFGHSMIIGPWGQILAEKPDGVGIITADLNLEEVEKARKAIPALQHDREYTIEKI